MNNYSEKCDYKHDNVDGHSPWMVQKRTLEENTFDVVKRDWNELFKGIVSKYVLEKNIVVQAGGWQGMYPRLLSKMFNRVYTFEPDPINFHCLVNNCQENNILKYQAALGSECRIDTFEVVNGGKYATGQGRIKHKGSFDENFELEEIPVQTLTIDSLQLQDCSLIMSDTEGWGLELLRGASDTIRKFSPTIILEKYHLREVTQKEFDFLKTFGYACVHEAPNDLVFINR